MSKEGKVEGEDVEVDFGRRKEDDGEGCKRGMG